MSGGRHALPSPLRRIFAEIARFGLVGLSGIAVNLAVFNLLRLTTQLPPVRASVLATAVAVATNYLGFRYFTYRDRPAGGRRRELTLFAVFSAAGLVIENGVLFTAAHGLGLDGPLLTNLAKFAGIGVATLFRFWSYRTWVFRAAAAQAGAGAGTGAVQAGAETGAGPTGPLPVPAPAPAPAASGPPRPLGAVNGLFTDVAHGAFSEAETLPLTVVASPPGR
ncbi:GtrA family protein [Streptomyces sp. NPDC060194]|uniref:GtrA family protein n=1 Tax=Streptomyces sp. NPDC060194 TaxID=3347069 RepID=UPI0036534D2E